jgi:diguanylate cyclase (GGDEF)-like protein
MGDAREADFEAALLREQYRTLARLGPYINGVVILATVALCATAQRTSSLLDGMVLPAALLAASLYRLISWLKARRRVDLERLDVIRRKILATSVLAPGMAFALSLMAASMRQGNILELSLALAAVSVVAAASAFYLNALAGAGSLVVVAWAAPLVVALVDRGDGLSLWLAALMTAVSCFVIRMLGENFRIFAEIVRSRFALAEQQRAAEDARQAAMAIALTDDLTGLPNRRCFFSLLADRVRAGKESAAPFAVGLIDLDGFKPINDIHGHPAGDETLRQVAARLAKAIEGRGSAARMGGDEFAILCDGAGARDQAIALGEEIQAIFATPFAVEGLDIRLTGACGFALFPSSATDADELVRFADAALYRAKAAGPGGVAVFDAKAESKPAGSAALEDALRRAVAESKIGVFFRPIVDSTTGRISGFESLARWNDATLGPIAPSVFIAVAEQIGVFDELRRDLLRKAAKVAARWPSDVSLSFNLSAGQLSTPTTDLRVASALEELGLPPIRFDVEVSEAAITKNLDSARATIEALRTAGARMALDDFGAGALVRRAIRARQDQDRAEVH